MRQPFKANGFYYGVFMPLIGLATIGTGLSVLLVILAGLIR